MTRSRTFALAALLFLPAALAISACGPSRGAGYDRALADARTAQHDGRFDLAASKFEEASKDAKQPRDAVYTKYEAALAWARAGDTARAATVLRALADAKPVTQYSAQAAFKLAQLTRASDDAAGFAMLEPIISAYPEDGIAQVSLGLVIRHDDETSGTEAALAHLDRIALAVKGTKVEEKVLYERARHLDTLGRTEAARDAYVETANKFPYPFGGFNDDALFRAAEMEEKLGRPKEAIALLERLLSQREVSGFLGSYERPRYLPALLRIAEIQETKLNDRAAARATLHRLYADFTTSTMRDDALWREAELFRKDGDQTSACDRLSTLTGDFPDSRYVPCASAKCPAIKRPAKSKAPATCHDYLTREAPPAAPEAPEEAPKAP
jgi:outer membrane protein assembly factor BamD (BamD/ComL family)